MPTLTTLAKPRDILQRAIEISKKIKNTRKRHNFFEIATIQPRNGVGMLFQRKAWNPKSYYEITKVIVQPVCFDDNKLKKYSFQCCHI